MRKSDGSLLHAHIAAWYSMRHKRGDLHRGWDYGFYRILAREIRAESEDYRSYVGGK